MTNNRVLYISYDGLTDPLGQSQIIPYLEGLSKAGYSISIISCEKKEKQNLSSSIQKILDENNIKWIPISYTKKPPVLSTVYDIWKISKAARWEFKKNPFSIIHCRSYITSLVGLSLKKSLGIKFIFDMRGFWADERVEGNIWSLSNPVFKMVYSFFKKKEKEFLTNADHIISLTQNAADEIHTWKQLPGQPLPIKVIPCCVDMDLFDSTKISSEQVALLKQKLNISASDFVLSYIGSIGTWYLLDNMLRFFKQLSDVNTNAKFLFVTNDPSESITEKALSFGISKEKILIHRAERKEMPLYIKCSDASIFFIKQSFSKKASSPVKQGEIMSMGIPIICNDGVGDTGKIINESGAGIAIKDFSSEQFARAIHQIDNLLKISPVQIRSGAEKFYSLKNGINDYLEVYDTLSKK